MRWIFLTLVLLNLLFAVLEWQAGMGGHRGQEKGYLLASGGERLLLLGEKLQTFSAGRNEGERGDLCLLVGPLRDRGNAKLLIEALGHSDVGAGLVTQAIVRAPNYWVYLEPYESRKSAIVKLRELKWFNLGSCFYLNLLNFSLIINRKTGVLFYI